MFCKSINEVTPQLRILNILEHKLNGRHDLFRIVFLHLSIEELLHAIMLLRRESHFLSLRPGSLMHYSGEPLAQIN